MASSSLAVSTGLGSSSRCPFCPAQLRGVLVPPELQVFTGFGLSVLGQPLAALYLPAPAAPWLQDPLWGLSLWLEHPRTLTGLLSLAKSQ